MSIHPTPTMGPPRTTNHPRPTPTAHTHGPHPRPHPRSTPTAHTHESTTHKPRVHDSRTLYKSANHCRKRGYCPVLPVTNKSKEDCRILTENRSSLASLGVSKTRPDRGVVRVEHSRILRDTRAK
eukprot:1365546-Amorphochlora_amoeboformis.AAC.2